MTAPRVCILCKHFELDTGDYGYSEYTPGSDAKMECSKKRWPGGKGIVDFRDLIGTDDYARLMLTAETCNDYRGRGP